MQNNWIEMLGTTLLVLLLVLLFCNVLSTYITYYLIKLDIEEINEDNIDLKVDLLQSLKSCKDVIFKGLIYHREVWFFSTYEDWFRYSCYYNKHPHHYFCHKSKQIKRIEI